MLRAVRMLRGPADVGARLTWALVTASLADQLAVAADAGLLRLPDRPGAGRPAHGRDGARPGPADHAVHRCRYSRNDPVSTAASPVIEIPAGPGCHPRSPGFAAAGRSPVPGGPGGTRCLIIAGWPPIDSGHEAIKPKGIP